MTAGRGGAMRYVGIGYGEGWKEEKEAKRVEEGGAYEVR